jgi:hypothetical protein
LETENRFKDDIVPLFEIRLLIGAVHTTCKAVDTKALKIRDDVLYPILALSIKRSCGGFSKPVFMCAVQHSAARHTAASYWQPGRAEHDPAIRRSDVNSAGDLDPLAIDPAETVGEEAGDHWPNILRSAYTTKRRSGDLAAQRAIGMPHQDTNDDHRHITDERKRD